MMGMVKIEHIENHKDDLIWNTCQAAIHHLKGVAQYHRASNGDTLCFHSRFLSSLFYPEEKLILRYKSQAFINAGEAPEVLYVEHIVPMVCLCHKLWTMFDAREQKKINITDEELTWLLYSNIGIAFITKEEACELNLTRDEHGVSLKNEMPKDWVLGKDEPKVRLERANIKAIPTHIFAPNINRACEDSLVQKLPSPCCSVI